MASILQTKAKKHAVQLQSLQNMYKTCLKLNTSSSYFLLDDQKLLFRPGLSCPFSNKSVVPYYSGRPEDIFDVRWLIDVDPYSPVYNEVFTMLQLICTFQQARAGSEKGFDPKAMLLQDLKHWLSHHVCRMNDNSSALLTISFLNRVQNTPVFNNEYFNQLLGQITASLDKMITARSKVFIYKAIVDKLDPLMSTGLSFLNDCTLFSFFIFRDSTTPVVLPNLDILRSYGRDSESSESAKLSKIMSTVSGCCVATLIESSAFLHLFPTANSHANFAISSLDSEHSDLNPFINRGIVMLPSAFAPSTVDGTLFGTTKDHTKERMDCGLLPSIQRNSTVASEVVRTFGYLFDIARTLDLLQTAGAYLKQAGSSTVSPADRQMFANLATTLAALCKATVDSVKSHHENEKKHYQDLKSGKLPDPERKGNQEDDPFEDDLDDDEEEESNASQKDILKGQKDDDPDWNRIDAPEINVRARTGTGSVVNKTRNASASISNRGLNSGGSDLQGEPPSSVRYCTEFLLSTMPALEKAIVSNATTMAKLLKFTSAINSDSGAQASIFTPAMMKKAMLVTSTVTGYLPKVYIPEKIIIADQKQMSNTINGVGVSSRTAIAEGWLFKRGPKEKSLFLKRYYRLYSDRLEFCKDIGDEAQGFFEITASSIVKIVTIARNFKKVVYHISFISWPGAPERIMYIEDLQERNSLVQRIQETIDARRPAEKAKEKNDIDLKINASGFKVGRRSSLEFVPDGRPLTPLEKKQIFSNNPVRQAEAYYIQGHTHLSLAHPARALRCFVLALELQPSMPKYAEGLARAAFEQSQLETQFSFSFNNFTSSDFCRVQNYLTSRSVSRIRLQHKNLTDDVLLSLLPTSMPSVMQLDLSFNQLSNGCGVQLAAFLTNPSNKLCELDISRNRIGEPGLEALAHALRSNNTLTILNLGNNKLGDSGLGHLLLSIASNPYCALVSLDVAGLPFGCAAAEALCTLLQARVATYSRFQVKNLSLEGKSCLVPEELRDAIRGLLTLTDSPEGLLSGPAATEFAAQVAAASDQKGAPHQTFRAEFPPST